MADDDPDADVPSDGPSEPRSPASDDPAEGEPGRRRFLKIATCAIGGGIGAVVTVPAIRYLLYPVGRDIVTTGGEPIVVGGIEQLDVGAAPVRVAVTARAIRDAWSSVTNVPLGAAWLRRTGAEQIEALSSVCPHLGCAVSFDDRAEKFKCPCHDSAFSIEGKRLGGPAERGLDSLPWTIDKDGRIAITWIRYRQGGSSKTPV